MDDRSLAALSKALAEITENDFGVIESRKADRAQRLSALLESDVWKLDLYPLLRQLHDKYLNDVKAKTMDSDALKPFDDFLGLIDGTIRIGAGAMERLAAKRAKAAAIQNKINQQQAPKPLSEF